MPMERLYALNSARPAQQLTGGSTAKLGEVLNLRVEARTPSSIMLRSADGRSFQFNNSNMAPDMDLEPGQAVRAQVTSVRPLQLAILTAAPAPPGPAAAQAPAAMAVAAQMQAQMQAQKATGLPIAPDQLLLQRLLQATGAEAVAQAWRGLALGRMQQPDPQPMLPQFWMFHAYAWNESLPLSFWLLRRQEDEAAPPPRPPSRLLKLRLRFHHPVYGWMLLDVYVDEMNVALNIHVEQKEDAGELTSRLRPAISAALAHAGLRLLQFHVRADLMNPQDPASIEPELGQSGALSVDNALPEADLLHQPQTTLAPALFLAAAEVLEALRAA